MNLITSIDIPKLGFSFSYADKIMLLGSCFAENIGGKLSEDKFKADINPFGTLYNPASVAAALRLLLFSERYVQKDLFCHEGVYHSFDHHSRFSAVNPADCLNIINERLEYSSDWLYKSTRLIVTFGSAYVYRLKSSGEVVANCHKLPEKMFERSMLSVEEIVEEWQALLLSVWEHLPQLKVLFTVSPVRHWKDGAHVNQLSKATLLLAVDEIVKKFPDNTAYFPAYEIMMDELRDYRFYNEDMIHPSDLAINHIWNRFSESILSKDILKARQEWHTLKNAMDHKPFHPQSESYQSFLRQTLLKVEQFAAKFPNFDVSDEVSELKSRIN